MTSGRRKGNVVFDDGPSKMHGNAQWIVGITTRHMIWVNLLACVLRHGIPKEGHAMPNSHVRLSRAPVGTKYVLEACGPVVRRYVEFPDGRRVTLAKRKAAHCGCIEHSNVSIIPVQGTRIGMLPKHSKAVSTYHRRKDAAWAKV